MNVLSSRTRKDQTAQLDAAARRPRVLALINVDGRMAATMARETLRQRLDDAFLAAGLDAELMLLAGADLPGALQTVTARARDFDALAVGGGDGTINAAAAHLAGTGIPLGVLPLGTLNHFARDLGIPPLIELACLVIAEGHVRAVDVGEVNGRIFINNSSIGIYPYMVETRDVQRRALGLGKWGAMALSCLWILRRFPIRRLLIRAGHRARRHKTPCAFIGNNRYELEGPQLGTRAALDRGELWTVVARSRSRLHFLLVVLKAMAGRGRPHRNLEEIAATSVVIKSRARRLRVALDGEVAKMEPPLHYRIRPGALRVLAPRVRIS